MKIVRLTCITTVILLSWICRSNAQYTTLITLNFHKKIDSLGYKSGTSWYFLTPFLTTKKEFYSEETGEMERVGIFGQNVKKYLNDDKDGLRYIKAYQNTRIAGIVVMWGGSFTCMALLSGGYYQEGTEPVLVSGLLGSLYVGSIIYHYMSRDHLFKALYRLKVGEKYDAKSQGSLIPWVGIRVDQLFGIPQLSVGTYF